MASGNAAAKRVISASGPQLTRMQRFCGATNGMRTKMPSLPSSSTIWRAKAPSLPQSMATKFVADGSGFKPFSNAMEAIRARDFSTCATVSAKCASSESAAFAPARDSRDIPK